MKFAYPWLLFLTPPVILVVWLALRWGQKRRRLLVEKFTGDPARHWSSPGFSDRRRQFGTLLTLTSLAFLLVSLARPLVFSKAKMEELQGIHYLVLLDASRSMLATDVKPTRYGAATNALDRWLDETRADRVGIITFAGDAYLNAPLTFDTAALRTVLRFIEPESIYEGGSTIAKAIERAANYFASNDIPQHVVIIISDGEELEGNAIETARKFRRSQHLTLCTVGVGTAAGARVPTNRRGGAWGSQKNTFGQEVTTRIDEGNLKRIANAGGGRYYALGPRGEGLDQLRQEVLRPLAEAAARDNLQNYVELYQIPLVLSLLGMLFQLWLRPEIHRSLKPDSQPIVR